MPGIQCSFGDVTRLDLPMPFFLRDEPFTNFRNENYDWEPKKSVTVLVKTIKRSPIKSVSIQAENPVNNVMGGCPLECTFDPNENFESDARKLLPNSMFSGLDFNLVLYDSMDLQKCRNLVKRIYEGDEDTVQNLCLDRVAGKRTFSIPIYVACDGSPNAKDLVMIGFDDEKFLELRMMGPYKRQSTQLNLELFLAYHQHLPNVNPTSIHRQVHAVYEKPHGNFPTQGKMFIEFLWNDPKVLFEAPPPQSARVKLAVKPHPGDANLSLRKLWEEVEVLNKLVDVLDKSQLINMDRSHLSLTAIQTNSAAMEAMTTFLTQQSVPVWKKGTDFTASVETVLNRTVNQDRSEVDFCDRIWMVFQKAKTLQELWICFQMLFSAVESKLYRPYILPSSAAIISTMLTKLVNNQIANYRSVLTPLLVVEMTLDCGLNKLFKDYSFVFSMCHLAEQNECKIFCPRIRAFKESLMNIKKLHCVMEILCLSKERVSLTMNDLEVQTRKLFYYFSKHKLNWDHTFHFDVPISAIASALSGLHPVYWNLKLESSNSLRIARTNAILSRDFFVGHARKFYISQDGSLPRGYYLYVHRIAQRKM